VLTLHVDVPRWRAQHERVRAAYPGLVPVIKGNGYGFGLDLLAHEAARLGADTVAVGTDAEARQLCEVEQFARVVVLTPAVTAPAAGTLPAAAVRTVATVAGVEALGSAGLGVPDRRAGVIVECLTSMRRHGVTADDLPALRVAQAGVRLEGFSLHLPIDRPDGVDPPAEVSDWVERLSAAGLPTDAVWVSHLSSAEVGALQARFPATTFRARIGTALWLGDETGFRARGRVVDVLALRRGERYGYRQRRAPGDGHLLIVGGGTAQGIALEAPRAVRGLAPRVRLAATAGLAVANRTLSPFTWAGRKRWFAEPPHMQVSLLWLPAAVAPPAIGAELDATVRMTTVRFDSVSGEGLRSGPATQPGSTDELRVSGGS